MVNAQAKGPCIFCDCLPEPTPAHPCRVRTVSFAGEVSSRKEFRIDKRAGRQPRLCQRQGEKALQGWCRALDAVMDCSLHADIIKVSKLTAEGGVDVVQRIVTAHKHPRQGIDRE